MGLFSCSFVTDFDQVQCDEPKDCRALGPEFIHGDCVEGLCEPGPLCLDDDECEETESCVDEICVDRWACLDDKVSAAEDPVAVQVPVISIFGDPMPDVPVRVCSVVDIDCKEPTLELVSDEDGLLSFEVQPTFRGYLDARVPGFFPQISFLPDVLTNPSFLPPLSLSPAEIIEALAEQVGAAADPDRGHLVVTVASCSGGAPNLVITSKSADDQAIRYYVSANVPAPDRESTTEEGSGGFLNLVVRAAEVTVSTKDGKELFSTNIFTRKGTISSVHFQPPSLAAAGLNQDGDSTK